MVGHGTRSASLTEVLWEAEKVGDFTRTEELQSVRVDCRLELTVRGLMRLHYNTEQLRADSWIARYIEQFTNMECTSRNTFLRRHWVRSSFAKTKVLAKGLGLLTNLNSCLDQNFW